MPPATTAPVPIQATTPMAASAASTAQTRHRQPATARAATGIAAQGSTIATAAASSRPDRTARNLVMRASPFPLPASSPDPNRAAVVGQQAHDLVEAGVLGPGHD